MLSFKTKERYITAGYNFIRQGNKLMNDGEELIEKANADKSVVILDAYCKDSAKVAGEVIDTTYNATKSRFEVFMDILMWLLATIFCCMVVATSPDKATVVVSTSLATISGAFLMASFDLYMKRDK